MKILHTLSILSVFMISIFLINCPPEKKQNNAPIIGLAAIASRPARANSPILTCRDVSGTVNVAITPVIPCTISPSNTTISTKGYRLEDNNSPVSGLIFDSATGTLSGTPTRIVSSETYRVFVEVPSGGNEIFLIQAPIKFTITGATIMIPSSLTFSNSRQGIVTNSPMQTITNTTTIPSGVSVIYSINGSLPTGLNFNSSTGAISGTPTVTTPSVRTYTITGTFSLNTTIGFVLINANSSPTPTTTGLVNLYVNSAANITNSTCNTTLIFPGCTDSFPFSCPNSSTCSRELSRCYADLSCGL